MNELREGGCACGAIRYRLTDEPMFVHCCHCRLCQRQTGSAFVLNAIIEADRVVVTGPSPLPVSVPTDTGQSHQIFRCAACQIALWSVYRGRTPLRFVRVGTLDDPTTITPDVYIWVSSKLPWVVLPPGARAFDRYYEMPAEWPAASLERRRAALATWSDGKV